MESIFRIDRPNYPDAVLAALKYTIGFVLAGSVAFVAAILVLTPDQVTRTFGPASLSLVAGVAWFLLSSGRVTVAVHLLAFGSWVAVTGIAFFNGGVRAMAIIVYPHLILLLGWLIGTRAAAVMAALAVAATTGFVLAESFDFLPVPPHTPPLMRLIVFSFIFVFSVVLITSFVRSYQDRLKDADKLAVEVAQRENRLSAIFHASPIGISVTSVADGKILEVNDAALRLYGYERDAVIGRTLADLVIYTDPAQREELVRQLRTQGSAENLPIAFRNSRGENLMLEISGRVVTLQDAQCLVAMMKDVTEPRRLEGLLRSSDERYRALFDGNPMPVFAVDTATMNFIAVNKAAIDKYGYSREELLAMTIVDLQIPEDREGISAELSGRYAQGAGKVERLARRHCTKDGQVILAEVTAQPFAFDNRIARLISVNDVTESRRVASEILKLNVELERRVEQRTHDLQVANRELESFAYSVSHDLRAPLRALNGFSRLLETQYAGRIDDEGRGMLRRVRQAADRMGQLIDDLLKLSRISRQEMKRGPVDLSALARESAEDLQGAEPERKVEWVIAPQVTAEGDPGLLRVVLQNLIGNAWKYSSKRDTARIEFGIFEKDGRPAYFVSDNGAGFDMEYADKLFGAFQRLHSPAEFPGIGIGLATVARIIHRHKGDVGADGRIGEGARFYFTL